MSKRTPGPWTVVPWDRNPELFGIEFGYEGEHIADTVYVEADAHLIAAAPTLLEACEEALSFFAGISDPTTAEDAIIGELGAAIAIAKAEGGAA